MSMRSRAALVLVILAGCENLSGPRQPVAAIELAAPPPVWVGDLRTLLATPRASDGRPLHGRVITWTSSDPAVATIDTSGVLTAHAIGATTVSASCEGRRADLSVSVGDLDLIYEGMPNGVSEMLVLALGGGAPARVLPHGVTVTAPVPSPDGTRIAFVAATVEKPDFDIYVVNRDGTGLVRLTHATELDENPSWSPDGTRIAFRSFRAGGSGDIWVMHSDGSSPVNLTPDPPSGVTDERRPAWSPDGTSIAFASTRGGTLDIWTMRADGTGLYQVTNTPEYDTEPTWSPAGNKIAFRRSDDDNSDILVVGPRGGRAQRLSFLGHELMPSWSPNGNIIAYAQFSPAGGNPQIYTVRPDGTERTLRTTNPDWMGGIEPSWIRK